MQEVVRAPGLAPDAATLEAAEGMAAHQRAGDLAVDVQVADAEIAPGPFDVSGAAGVDAAGQRVARPFAMAMASSGPRPHHRQDGAEYLLLAQ